MEPEAEAPASFGNRIRRPSSLLADGPIPPRASALRHSLSDKIASVTHHADGPAGDEPIDPGAGAEFAARAVDDLGSRGSRVQKLTERARVLAADRPEVVVGAAFAGGLLLATILRRLAR
jgi:hypothetical protein